MYINFILSIRFLKTERKQLQLSKTFSITDFDEKLNLMTRILRFTFLAHWP